MVVRLGLGKEHRFIIIVYNRNSSPDYRTALVSATDVYREMVKSDYADLLNTSKGSGAGTITAAMFLENFVNDTPWVHLDIAGTAHGKSARGYLPQGATGVHVKTLYKFIKGL